jgi:hypothetical protein
MLHCEQVQPMGVDEMPNIPTQHEIMALSNEELMRQLLKKHEECSRFLVKEGCALSEEMSFVQDLAGEILRRMRAPNWSSRV